jgi:seryl-tRNA synthetase
MKKIFALIVALLLLCVLHVAVFAEEDSGVGVEVSEGEADVSSSEEEEAVEGEISSDSDPFDISSEMVVEYVKGHIEEISVIITLILTAIYNVRKHRLLNRSISATNRNAIAVSENSERAIADAFEKMNEFSKLLDEYRASAEEKRQLEKTLEEAMLHIKNAKLANVEFANELAELLVLANIPNAKKDELYARHLAAVSAIAEKSEVIADEIGKEA